MLTFTFRLSDNNNNHTPSCADIGDTVNRAANDPSVLKITDKAPTVKTDGSFAALTVNLAL